MQLRVGLLGMEEEGLPTTSVSGSRKATEFGRNHSASLLSPGEIPFPACIIFSACYKLIDLHSFQPEKLLFSA